MKDQDFEISQVKQGDEIIQRKLDSNLRRLLQMEDDEIQELIRRDQERLGEAKEKSVEKIEPLELTTSEEDQEAIPHIQELQRKDRLSDQTLAAVVRNGLVPVRVRAIVRFTGNRADLERLGLEVRSQAQDVFTVVGTRHTLLDLASQPACRRLRTPRILVPTVRDACIQAEIATVHEPRPLYPTGFQGNGVLIGIIDVSALDVTHHGFREPTGDHNSRVLYYWVQTPYIMDADGHREEQNNPPGQTPQEWFEDGPDRPDFTGLTYGRLYTQSHINNALRSTTGPYGTGHDQICCEPEPEEAEHGTHCAGIAAGNGHYANWDIPPTHIGAAPQSTIVYVSVQSASGSGQDEAFEDAILDAIAFCFAVADSHDRPIVISASLGTNLGPHNGSTNFDLAQDHFLDSHFGRSIVWAAGNDNDDNGYRSGEIGPSTDSTYLTLTPNILALIWLDIWYTGPELDYRIWYISEHEIRAPWYDAENWETRRTSTAWYNAGHADYSGNLVGDLYVEVERDSESGDGLHNLRIRFDSDGHGHGHLYKIQLRNPSTTHTVNYHAWVGTQGGDAGLDGASQNELTLGDTACGRSILTVGSCEKPDFIHPVYEQITRYSGAGSTLDGRIKPEIVAIGGTHASPVLSAKSDQNSGYIGLCGTSMAAPLVAGAVALLFEAYSGLGYSLNQDTIKALLIQHALRDPFMDSSHPGYRPELEQHLRNLYGYGRLRLIGPIDRIQPPVDVDLWVRTADGDYGDIPYAGRCFCCSPDIRVYDADGNETTQLHWDTPYYVEVTVRNLGDSNAVAPTVRLKYTVPHTAPNAWFEVAEDASRTVLAMNQHVFIFAWRPQREDIVDAPSGQTHFCLLAEVDHPADPLRFPAPTRSGGDAWATNIRGTNNVALRNLHIQ